MTNGRHHTSVVICCYTEERFDDLLAAVDSAQRQSVPAHEIAIVVDHNEALLERVRSVLPGLLTVENAEPRGLSGARNTGVATTTGNIVAFLDDDAVAEPDWLERLCEPYSDDVVAGVGGSIAPAWQGGRPAWFPEEFDWVVGCTYRGLPDRPTPVRNLIGANMSFRRRVLEATGGFDVEMGRTGSYPLGNDDTDFCIRASRAHPGHVLLYEPGARVRHTVTPVRASWSYFRTRCFAEGLAKAALTGVSGSGAALASERAYVARVIPRGFARGLASAVTGDVAGFRRSLAIASGLGITTTGYATGRARAAAGVVPLVPGAARRLRAGQQRGSAAPTERTGAP